jgi:hypothetical protein
MDTRKPTGEGVRRWPPDGYLQLNLEADVRQQVPCTCTDRCGECRGQCGCAACELGWLVYQEEQALWDDHGNLVNVIELGPAWKRVADPRQLRLRFEPELMREPAAANHTGSAGRADGSAPAPDTPVDTDQATWRDHRSVPPIFQEATPSPPSTRLPGPSRSP